jgi:hypothetical protein
MYQHLVLGDTSRIRSEVIYINRRHRWTIRDIPDPRDPDPARYAIVAVMTIWLCEAINWRIEHALHRDAPDIFTDIKAEELLARTKLFEEIPHWAMRVAKLKEEMAILNGEGNVPDDACKCPELERLGIVCEKPNLCFV